MPSETRDPARLDPCEFEVGPIRPPSEAQSLLVRVTRNCPWNKCTFCPVYKRRRFSVREVEEVEADVEAMGRVADEIRAACARMGFLGRVDRASVSMAAHSGLLDRLGPNASQVALWLIDGGRTVFLQDANSLVLKPDRLIRVIRKISRVFPEVDRITSYARSHSLSKIPLDKLKEMREAGLNRIHVGMESGSDEVLRRVRKGTSQAQQIEAGKRVVEAGMELCEYVMPGLGGAELSAEHAAETAFAVNAVKPQFVRLRSLAARKGTPLADEVEVGGFKLMNDEEVVKEIRSFIEELDPDLPTILVSDHILNLLEEIEGPVSKKEKLLGVIDAFFDMPPPRRLLFRLSRRLGFVRSMSDLSNPLLTQEARDLMNRIDGDTEQAEALLARLVTRFV